MLRTKSWLEIYIPSLPIGWLLVGLVFLNPWILHKLVTSQKIFSGLFFLITERS